jgi:hypothetical protein
MNAEKLKCWATEKCRGIGEVLRFIMVVKLTSNLHVV